MSSDVAPVCLRAEHAIELGELLEFLASWLADASDVCAEALAGFCGPSYPLGELRADLARFAFLLGADGQRFVFGEGR
ncbi:MAG: hypothetical protein LC749_03120 [Actinobacteria bacterium]|nr:hypothetical protein [Actinomycetota bacterium]